MSRSLGVKRIAAAAALIFLGLAVPAQAQTYTTCDPRPSIRRE